jgi:alanyl-tRNA synthetase
VAEKVFYDEAAKAKDKLLPGDVAFKLYDTYGLALEEQQDMAQERGMGVDLLGFEMEMDKQRTRARASWKGAEKSIIRPEFNDIPITEFVGRESLETEARIELASETEVFLDRTPFYAESGGQVGDTGILVSKRTGDVIAIVENAVYGAPTKTLHKIKLVGAGISPGSAGEVVIARVDAHSRYATMRNHTGTHLLHAALRKVLGTHVKQAGSVVEPGRLRFDFTHYAAMDAEELAEVERLMNEEILANREVDTKEMSIDEALSIGAMALFGEKYGERVRVVSIAGLNGDTFSKELCGGTHVSRTGDIGVCKIVYEGSISAGVRRIEAITGEGALKRFQDAQGQLTRAAAMLRTSEDDLAGQIDKLLAKEKSLEQELQQLKTKAAQAQAGDLDSQAKDIKGAKVLAVRLDGFDRAQLRTLADTLRNKWKSAVLVLTSVEGSDVTIVSAVTKDLTAKVHAGKLAGAVAQAVGGKGGGRPDMAEAGGKDPAALAQALADVYTSVEGML